MADDDSGLEPKDDKIESLESELAFEDDDSEDGELSGSRLPGVKVSENKAALGFLAKASLFQGPLPPPEQLEAYNRVNPDFAERIFRMAERQSEHRRFLEKTTLLGDGKRSWAGIVAAFLISISSIGGSVYLISRGAGRAVGGTILGSTTIVALVKVFLDGTDKRRKERESRQKRLLGKEENEDD